MKKVLDKHLIKTKNAKHKAYERLKMKARKFHLFQINTNYWV